MMFRHEYPSDAHAVDHVGICDMDKGTDKEGIIEYESGSRLPPLPPELEEPLDELDWLVFLPADPLDVPPDPACWRTMYSC
jgi:hypothetical protein